MDRLSLDYAYKIFEGRLAEFNENPLEISRRKQEDPGYVPNYQGQLGFCYGCDERRAGDIMERRGLVFPDTPPNHYGYTEQICQGCDLKLRTLKELMIPVIQHMSHEGTIVWRIQSRYYRQFEHVLSPFFDHDYDFQLNEDRNLSVLLSFSDDGETALGLTNALIAIRQSLSSSYKKYGIIS